MITDSEIREAYREDTIGRKYHSPIVSKNKTVVKEDASEPITLKYDEPLTYKEFRELNDALQIIYLDHLKQTYHITGNDVCELFGISRSCYQHSIVKRLGLKRFFGNIGSGYKQGDDVIAWKAFLAKRKDVETIESDSVAVLDEIEVPTIECEASYSTIKTCSFTQVGNLDTKLLIKRITAMVEEGTDCLIHIQIDTDYM